MPADEKTLQHDIDLARADILRGQAPSALGRLKRIQLQIDDLPRTVVWVEHQLVYASALGAMMDTGASTAFVDTFSRISQLEGHDPALEMRAHEYYAKYLVGIRSLKDARSHYREAEIIAEDSRLAEEVAHYQLCIVCIDLEEERSPRRTAFRHLKQAAKEGYTAVEQIQAWVHYCEEMQEFGGRLLAARKGSDSSVEYFLGVLSKIRRDGE